MAWPSRGAAQDVDENETAASEMMDPEGEQLPPKTKKMLWRGWSQGWDCVVVSFQGGPARVPLWNEDATTRCARIWGA